MHGHRTNMTEPQDKPPRLTRKGRPLAKMKQATIDTIVLALAMELRDDITLLRMRADQLLAALNTEDMP